jgi:hypothetical protein
VRETPSLTIRPGKRVTPWLSHSEMLDATQASRPASSTEVAATPNERGLATAHPTLSELRSLQSMSVRDAAVATSTSGGTGKLLQNRALLMAANLAEGDK